MPEIIAHRGASGTHPENTVEAFRAASDLGAGWVEFDVRRCGSGELVIAHDPDLSDGRAVSETTRGDLPVYVPTLEQALDACGPLGVNVEIKNFPGDPAYEESEAISDEVAALLLARGTPDRFLVSSFGPACIDAVRRAAPTLTTAALCLDPTDDVIRSAQRRGHQALHPPDWATTSDVIDAAHGAGLVVNVWTINDPDRMTELAAWGADGIVTDHPEVARELFG